jgi:hypothetical protein
MPSNAILLGFGFSRCNPSELAKSFSKTILVAATHEDCFSNSEKQMYSNHDYDALVNVDDEELNMLTIEVLHIVCTTFLIIVQTVR